MRNMCLQHTFCCQQINTRASEFHLHVKIGTIDCHFLLLLLVVQPLGIDERAVIL